jgi:hypothetical protein
MVWSTPDRIGDLVGNPADLGPYVERVLRAHIPTTPDDLRRCPWRRGVSASEWVVFDGDGWKPGTPTHWIAWMREVCKQLLHSVSVWGTSHANDSVLMNEYHQTIETLLNWSVGHAQWELSVRKRLMAPST